VWTDVFSVTAVLKSISHSSWGIIICSSLMMGCSSKHVLNDALHMCLSFLILSCITPHEEYCTCRYILLKDVFYHSVKFLWKQCVSYNHWVR
jgi:hypothetical protein